MKSAQLLTHFDRINDAPEAILRLRRFILDLAVRGKLVEQDPSDEPASELIRRIDMENALMVEKGEIRKQKVLPVNQDEEPFAIPPNWVWTRLGRIGDWGSGSTPSRGNPDYFGGGITWLKSGELNDNTQLAGSEETLTELAISNGSFRRNRPGDVLMAMYGATIGKVAILAEPAVTNQAVCGCTPFSGVSSLYLFNFLVSQREQFHAASEGGAQPNISKVKILGFPFPVPPIAEQHRIVGKVDELMALCDRLEVASDEREKRRNRLASASLHHLNNVSDARAFREHARFYLNHLPHLTIHPNQIPSLRQTVLNIALRGQLIPQDPNDEPASELLKRIQAEKSLLVKERIIKERASIPLATESEFPSPIPSGWMCSNLQSLCISVTDGDHLPPPKTDQGIPFLVIGNVRDRILKFEGCRHVSEQYYNALDAIRRPQKGDILYTLVGSYGIPVMITDDRQFCVQRHIGILRPSRIINAHFLGRVLESKWTFEQATACATGIAQKTVPLAGLRKILILLPPLAEQHRIVAKVDELMTLCDRLESQLTINQSESHRLLEAALHEALDNDLQVA